MGKEWRVFYISGTSNDHSDAPYDIWAELHREPGTPELRTDVYFPATDDVGVKLRNSTTLEIKVRQKRKKRYLLVSCFFFLFCLNVAFPLSRVYRAKTSLYTMPQLT